MKFSKLANKKILLDVPTSTLLGSLKERRIEYKLSVKQVAEKLCISISSIGYYERGIYPPSLLNLMNLAEFFAFDLSKSLNYKFFHGLIRSDEIQKRIKRSGLTMYELAHMTGYSRTNISEAVKLTSNASIFCVNAVLNALNNVRT